MTRLLRGRLSPELLLWFGVLGGPLSWIGMFVVSYGSYLASCGSAGSRWNIPVESWTIAATAAGAAGAVLAEIAALATYRAYRNAEPDSDPPPGRIRLLATMGIAVAPICLVIILYSGLGAISFPACRQS